MPADGSASSQLTIAADFMQGVPGGVLFLGLVCLLILGCALLLWLAGRSGKRIRIRMIFFPIIKIDVESSDKEDGRGVSDETSREDGEGTDGEEREEGPEREGDQDGEGAGGAAMRPGTQRWIDLLRRGGRRLSPWLRTF